MSRGNQNPMAATLVCIVVLVVVASGCNPFAGGSGAESTDEPNQVDESGAADDETSGPNSAESDSEAPSEGTSNDQVAAGADEVDRERESDAEGTDGEDAPRDGAPALPSLEEDEESTPEPSRRNPFAPQIEISEASRRDEQEDTETEDGRPPLQRYQIGSLRLTAIISEVSVPKVMFIDPSGTGHVAKEGDRIGTEGGRIEDIRTNAVVVTLPNGADEGDRRQQVIELREATMALGQQQGLDPEEQRILDELMQSDQGRKALQESYQQMESGTRSGREAGQRAPRRRQQNTTQGSGTSDERFPGLAPPSE